MNYLNQIARNEILMSAGLSWLIAQIIKTIIHLFVTRKFVAERLVGSGGMPSCHSATVCALTVSVLINCGLSSPEFAISFIVAIVVMYDAGGVRYETGIQAKVLNEMMEIFDHLGKGINSEEKLKELIGHTPLQVFVGGVLGITVSLIYCLFIII